MIRADLAFMEAAVAISLPVQELQASEQALRIESQIWPARREARSVTDTLEPVHPPIQAVLEPDHSIEQSCSSGQTALQVHGETGTFEDIILAAEEEAARGLAQPIHLPAVSESQWSTGIFAVPSTDLPLPHESGSDFTPETGMEGMQASGQDTREPPPESPLQLADYNADKDQQQNPGLVDAAVTAFHQASTMSNVFLTDRADSNDAVCSSSNEESSTTEEDAEQIATANLGAYAGMQAACGDGRSPITEPGAITEQPCDCDFSRRPEDTLILAQPPPDIPAARTDVIQSPAVCDTEDFSLGPHPHSTRASVQPSNVADSACVSPTATSATDAQHAEKLSSGWLLPELPGPPDSLVAPATVWRIEHRSTLVGTVSPVAAQADLSTGAGAYKAAERTPPEAAEGLEHECAEDRADSAYQSSTDAQGAASASALGRGSTAGSRDVSVNLSSSEASEHRDRFSGSVSAQMHTDSETSPKSGSAEYAGLSPSSGAGKHLDPASSSDPAQEQLHIKASPQSMSRGTFREDKAPLMQEILSSLQLSHSLTGSSQELMAAMQNMHTPSSMGPSGLLPSPACLALTSDHATHWVVLDHSYF